MSRIKQSRYPVIALVLIGAAIGYFAACSNNAPARNAGAAPTARNAKDSVEQGDVLAQAPTAAAAAAALGQNGKRPNIVIIMGDDIGWFNIGAYHRGMMSGRTPNIDRVG